MDGEGNLIADLQAPPGPPPNAYSAAQKYLSITHLLRGPGREPIDSYQKTFIRSGRTFDAGGEDGFHLISSAGVAHKQMILGGGAVPWIVRPLRRELMDASG
jgi:hypothetical protein